MLKQIPLFIFPPSNDYEASPQISWFIDKTDLIGKPVLYQLWQNMELKDELPVQVWVKVPTESRNKD